MIDPRKCRHNSSLIQKLNKKLNGCAFFTRRMSPTSKSINLFFTWEQIWTVSFGKPSGAAKFLPGAFWRRKKSSNKHLVPLCVCVCARCFYLLSLGFAQKPGKTDYETYIQNLLRPFLGLTETQKLISCKTKSSSPGALKLKNANRRRLFALVNDGSFLKDLPGKQRKRNT